jgi:hypothetical protein
MKSIKDIENLKGKRVIVRVDFNVPQDKEGKIVDDSMCSGLSVLSKSTFGKGSNDLLIPMLVLLVLVVLYLIFNQKIFGKKSSLFGKRR